MNGISMLVEKKLDYFTDKTLKLYPAAPEEAIINAETRLNCVLSRQY